MLCVRETGNILSGLLQYFPKNRAIIVQKLGAGKKLSKSVSDYFMTKKKKFQWPLILKGQGYFTIEKDRGGHYGTFFCGFPNFDVS